MTQGPVLIDLDDAQTPQVSEAAPVPDLPDRAPEGQAMQVAARLAARKPSRLSRWFWSVLGLLLSTVVSVAAWDFATTLMARAPILGWVVTALIGTLIFIGLLLAGRELAGVSRLRRMDSLRQASDAALASGDLGDARRVLDQLVTLYQSRDDTSWGRQRVADTRDDVLDADGTLALAETELLAPLDMAARAEIEAAARQVAMVTALVPLALADVVAALTSNIRMIRRIAEIYGGRSGTLGSWRLLRAVMTHLVATGAVAIGDDMIGTLAGGGALAKVSRRFGEGLVNGALTARVGVAAMDVCRPLPYVSAKRPSVTHIVKRSLTGLFGK